MPVLEYFQESVRRHAQSRPNTSAVRSGSTMVTWSELDVHTDKLAAAFQAIGIQNQRIAVLLEEPIAYVQVLIGALKAANCFVPLPLMATDAALARMLKDSGSSCLLFSESQRESATKLIALEQLTLKISVGCELSGCVPYDEFSDTGRECKRLEIKATGECNLIYSSGTTGTPKGILLENKYRLYQIPNWHAFGVNLESRVMVTASLYSNWALTAICATLNIGGTLIFPKNLDAESSLEACFDTSPTHLVTVPIQLNRMFGSKLFSSGKMMKTLKICAGSPFPAPDKVRAMANWPRGGLVDLYGSTEGGARTVLFAHENPDKLGSVGRPWSDMEGSVRIIDDAGKEVPTGQNGEIVGFSTVQMKEYANLPDVTNSIYWLDHSGTKYIRSGDIGRFDSDGFLYLSGRKKDMFISGGFNIYANDLEDVLRDHPHVVEAAVIGIPSDRWGESPYAYVVTQQEVSAKAEDILAWANERLGKAQRLIGLTVCPDLPRNSLGKVVKHALRENCEGDL